MSQILHSEVYMNDELLNPPTSLQSQCCQSPFQRGKLRLGEAEKLPQLLTRNLLKVARLLGGRARIRTVVLSEPRFAF